MACDKRNKKEICRQTTLHHNVWVQIFLNILVTIIFLILAWLTELRWHEFSQRDPGFISAMALFFFSLAVKPWAEQKITENISPPGASFTAAFLILRLALCLAMWGRLMQPPAQWWPDIMISMLLVNFVTFTFWLKRFALRNRMIEALDAIPAEAPLGYEIKRDAADTITLLVYRDFSRQSFESRSLVRNSYILASVFGTPLAIVLTTMAALNASFATATVIGGIAIFWFSLPVLIKKTDKRKPLELHVYGDRAEWNGETILAHEIEKMIIKQHRITHLTHAAWFARVRVPVFQQLYLKLKNGDERFIQSFVSRKKELLTNFADRANDLWGKSHASTH